jgi:hypothetical protein
VGREEMERRKKSADERSAEMHFCGSAGKSFSLWDFFLNFLIFSSSLML